MRFSDLSLDEYWADEAEWLADLKTQVSRQEYEHLLSEFRNMDRYADRQLSTMELYGNYIAPKEDED